MAIEYTLAEVRGIMLEAGIDPSDAGLVQQLLSAIQSAIRGAGEALQNMFAQQIAGSASPELIAAAQAQAERQVKKITGNLAQAELNKIADIIAKNIADGKNPSEAAKLLTDVKGLDKNRAATYRKFVEELEESGLSDEAIKKRSERKFKELLEDRRRSIASQETRIAQGEADRSGALANGDKFKIWISVGDARVDPEICQTNEARGWVDIDHVYTHGDQAQPGHVGCRCTVSYRKLPPGEAAQARATQAAENTADAIESAA